GREKLFLVWRVLALRAAAPALFCGADYMPLETSGAHGDRLLAFARRSGGAWLVSIVPRLVLSLRTESGRIEWGDTTLSLPDARWRDVVANRHLGQRAGSMNAGELLADFPVALLATS